MGYVGLAGTAPPKVTGLTAENVKKNAIVEVTQGSRVISKVEGTLRPAWVSIIEIPRNSVSSAKNTFTVSCTSCPGWETLTKNDFEVGFKMVELWFHSSAPTTPDATCQVTGYNAATGELTIERWVNDEGKFREWLSSTIIVAVKS